MMAGGNDNDPPGPERLIRYRWAAQMSAGCRVLDAACGTGWGTAVLAADATTAVGIDLSPAAIAAARHAHGELADFYEGDLRALPFGDEQFDCVACFEAIAHVSDPAQVIAELKRVLRPGGLLLASSPNPDVYPAGNPLHLSEMSSAQFESLLRQLFANVAVYQQQTYFASLLCDEATLAQGDPSTPVDARVAKLAGGPPGSELHAVAAATDGELPPVPAWLAIGEDVDYTEQRRLLEEWQDRAVRAEAEALALRRQLGALQD